MARRRRRRRSGLSWPKRVAAALLALPLLYLAAALAGSLLPVNRGWSEAEGGTSIYLASNGIHVDLLMPVEAHGLNWSRSIARSDFEAADPNASLIAFGIGERRVYLETPTWWDITPGTVWAALTGGERVMHVGYVANPGYAAREIRLRPEEYRRLWAAIRADLQRDPNGKPILIDHPGYGPSDRFYRASGRQNVLRTCNASVARWLRLAGVETSLWPPFAQGLLWRYRAAHQG